MIKKLQTSLAKEINAYNMTQNHIVAGIIIDKINELIDLVKEQQQQLNNHMCRLMALESDNKNIKDLFDQLHPELKIVRTLTQVDPIDPYAEQWEWIGKLCKLWNEDRPDELVYSILFKIYPDEKKPYQSIYTFFYTNCEPVSPDDDIIYKKD